MINLCQVPANNETIIKAWIVLYSPKTDLTISKSIVILNTYVLTDNAGKGWLRKKQPENIPSTPDLDNTSVGIADYGYFKSSLLLAGGFFYFCGEVMHNKQWFVVLAVLLAITSITLASNISISGQLIDSDTGNPVGDATIRYHNGAGENSYRTSNMAGIFEFEVSDLVRVYMFEISHVAYQTLTVEILSTNMFHTIKLHPATSILSEVVVSSGRGIVGQSPGAFSNLSSTKLDLLYSSQDPPMVVSEIPGATSYSMSGSDVGAAEIRIRGFGQDRISANVNGVPINDPEDHNIYWQNTPDFLSNTYDIQIERGVSSFTAGPAGIGGGLNLLTSDAGSKREFAISMQSGSYDTQRRTLSFRSGIIDEKYNFTGRFSRVTSDGYRDHTSSDMWSYFLAVTRFDANMITRVQLYGGQQEMDAYWWGLDKDLLAENRRANFSAKNKDYMGEYYGDWGERTIDYDGERDFFEQPHYMIHNQWRISSSVELDQSVFLIQGSGFYEEWKVNRKFAEYNIAPFEALRDENGDGNYEQVTISRSDLIRRKYVEKDQIGWLPTVKAEISSDTDMELGFEIRKFESDHWGKVMWAAALPESIEPQHEWYHWYGDKNYFGGYGNLTHDFNNKLTLNAGLQIRQVEFSVDQRIMGAFVDGYNYNVDWTFVNPRLGLSYQLDPSTSFYFSFAGAGREPMDDQILDPDNPKDKPKLSQFGLEEVNAEQMWDIEIGTRHNHQGSYGDLSMGINAYGMFFTDEIIQIGFSSEHDTEVFDNVPSSTHIGLELDGKWQNGLPGLTLSGNISYGRAIIGDYQVDYAVGVDEYWDPIYETVNVKGNRMALFPDLIANLRATYIIGNGTISFNIQHVGKQYMDNREDENAVLNAYTVLDGTLIFQINSSTYGGLDLEIRGMNIIDTEYEPFGIVDVEYGTPYYVPAAGRRYLAGFKLKF